MAETSKNDPIRDERPLWKLQAENGDANQVVTTSVQFFESLYANRTSRCRKLHHIARSVVVFDETQTLPPELLAPCLDTLKNLTKHLGTTAVLCTATQPAVGKLDPDRPGDSVKRFNKIALPIPPDRYSSGIGRATSGHSRSTCLSRVCSFSVRKRAR